MFGIYAILNLENGKYYVGSALDFEDRWRLHVLELNRDNHHNRHLQAAYNKYGRLAFLFVILEVTYDNSLEQREQYWIDCLQSTNHEYGYNICKAGRNRSGVKASEETREKLRLSHLGHKASDETKKKMSQSKIGNTFNNGRKWSKEAIENRRLGMTGKKRSEEAKARMSLAQTGKKHSDETRLKMSLAAKNRWKKAADPLDTSPSVWVERNT